MMSVDERRRRIEELQQAAWRKGDASAWFDQVYTEAAGEVSRIPWSQRGLNGFWRTWAERADLRGDGQTAVVIGCGLGENAEHLAARGFAVTAFDISPTAVEWCQRRFAGSKVTYRVGDLFTAARDLGQFDFVLEVHTLQTLPRSLRAQAVAAVAALARHRLLVICRGCETPEADEVIPWPLTRGELAGFARAGLREASFEDFADEEIPRLRRFRVEYRRS
jgi:SAM-dependent methyltransferase